MLRCVPREDPQIWQWHVKAGYNTLYESQQTGSIDSSDYSKQGNTPRLREGQLVGRIVRFSGSLMFPAVEKFFAETKSRTANCAVRLKVKLCLPAEDGNPREVGDLFSDWVVVARQDYQQILKSAVEHARKEKPQ